MTNAEKKIRHDICAYVAKWTPLLKLDHFEIVIVWPEDYDVWPETKTGEWPAWRQSGDKEGPHVYAATYRAKDYDVARLYFNLDVLSGLPQRHIEASVIHELLHVLTNDLEFILDLIEGLTHRDVDSVIEQSFVHAVEAAIDRLAFRFLDIANGNTS